MKCFCDHMLGTLAKWLRIYGFDTAYANSEMDDDDIIRISKKEKRILITRDKNLTNRVSLLVHFFFTSPLRYLTALSV